MVVEKGLVEVDHCCVVEWVVVDSSEVLEPLEQWEVKQVVVGLEAVPVAEMVVVWESSLERSAGVLW